MAKTGTESGARSASPLHLPISSNRSHDEQPEPDLEKSGSGCPNNSRGYVFINSDSGEIAPWRCGRNACAYCVQGNARRRARAIALAKPERALLLTQVGDSWQLVRDRAKNLRYFITKELGKSFDWVYHVEPNPKGTGHHVHAWQRGDFIAQTDLVRISRRVGMGEVAFINKIKNPLEAANYGLKGLGYGMKGVAAEESRVAYLLANGRRLTHQSRGFFVDSEGNGCGVRDAERAASAKGTEGGKWVLAMLPGDSA